jgi:hypothetical protein
MWRTIVIRPNSGRTFLCAACQRELPLPPSAFLLSHSENISKAVLRGLCGDCAAQPDDQLLRLPTTLQ